MKEAPKNIALDANILIRAVLGERVSRLFANYRPQVDFYTPEICFHEARKRVPLILARHHNDRIAYASGELERIRNEGIVNVLPAASYGILEREALQRIAVRDPNDWPLVATALLLDCPIWTEDNDFFGTGIAVWNTANVEIYLKGARQ